MPGAPQLQEQLSAPCDAGSPTDVLKFTGSSCSDLAKGSANRVWVGFVKCEFSCNHFHSAPHLKASP